MPPRYVKPYVKRNKNKATDAEGICEAVTRPNMRFVPIKTRFQEYPVVTTTEDHIRSHLSSRFGHFMVSLFKANTGTTAIFWDELNPCGFQYLTKCP